MLVNSSLADLSHSTSCKMAFGETYSHWVWNPPTSIQGSLSWENHLICFGGYVPDFSINGQLWCYECFANKILKFTVFTMWWTLNFWTSHQWNRFHCGWNRCKALKQAAAVVFMWTILQPFEVECWWTLCHWVVQGFQPQWLGLFRTRKSITEMSYICTCYGTTNNIRLRNLLLNSNCFFFFWQVSGLVWDFQWFVIF